MSTYAFFDTVAAVATPFGKGGVAVIRLSGTDAAAVAARLFRPRSGRALTDYPARVAVWGDILSPDEPGRVLDDGLCTLFLAPHSFTGEDVAEISCHGGVLVTRSVLDACLRAGARQALPGEFTRRAFLNGRLSLDEAEALGNLLEAGSDEQLRLSRAGMSGHLARETEAIYGALCPVLANLEAGIDFPEEDLTELTPAELAAAVAEAEGRVCRLLATYRTGHAIAEGIPTAICGVPNAGKSSLYNQLVGRDAAIVTAVAGTTRDVLSETVPLGRVTLRLSDTAGLRESADEVERIGVSRALAALEAAELVLWIADPTAPAEADADADGAAEAVAAAEASGKAVIRIRTRADLLPHPLPTGDGWLYISTVTGEGMDALREEVERLFIDGALRTGEDAVVFSARQAAALSDCADALRRVAGSLAAGLTADICAEDVRVALDALGDVCGRNVREDVISEIFSRFCVGK